MVSDLTGSESGGEMTLIDQLLNDQQKLDTPVVRFAEKHATGEIRTEIYKHLLPLEKPKEGQQYAFQVELDKCTSCKACVAACHSLNGLEEKEAWRDVGLITGGDDAPGWQQTVTTACHHCVEPECMHGCPVKAYEKDNVTGIVRHLDDQCIGCEYCSLKCPYDVPKYSSRLGIVRKCDMCTQRLEVGEAPACVQACPNEAIKIITVEQSEMVKRGEQKKEFLRGAPLPNLTKPTTVYIGRDVPETAVAADREKLTPAPSHWPLVLMLSLTQIGVGALVASTFKQDLIWAVIGLVVFFAGLSCSILHLGRPLGAWRFFLGLKTSWLSREILAFSVFAPIAKVYVASLALPQFFPKLEWLADFVNPVGITMNVIGLIAVFTSVMIYVDTGRENWKFPWTASAFFGTTLGAMGIASGQPLLATFALLPLLVDAVFIKFSKESEWSPKIHKARLMWNPLKKVTQTRLLIGALAIVISMVFPIGGLALFVASEILSRLLYFKAVQSPKMPGMP